LSDRYLLKGGTVLTLGAKTPNFPRADVLIEDGVIAEVGPGLRARDAEVVDAENTIVMPGFVDTHRHVWKSLFRNLGETGSNSDDAVSSEAYGQSYQPDDVYAATFSGLLGAIEAGITTVVDWADISFDPTHVDAALEAHNDAGLRSVFVYAMPAWEGGQEDEKASLRRLAARQANTDDIMTLVAFGPREPEHSHLDRVTRDFSLARELGMRVHTHVGVDPDQRGVVAQLGARGVLGSDVTLVHCTNLDPTDLDAISSTGSMVALTPTSEMSHGIGAPPVQELLDRKIHPGLGVDNEGSGQGDLFAQMRAAISLQHATYFDLKLAGKGGLPNLLSTRDVIRWATTDGARAAGLEMITGSLTPGMQADVVLLRTDRPNIFPINDPIGAVVWGMDTSNVDWVFVGGKPRLSHGVVHADVDRARSLVTAALDRVGDGVGAAVARQELSG